MGAPEPQYIYRARLVEVGDGDTMVLEIRLGCFVSTERTVRLLGLDTPEKKGATRAAGLAARDMTLSWFAAAILADPGTRWPFVVVTLLGKAEKYGRLLGTVYARDNPVSLNEALLAGGWAREYGGGPRS